VSTIPDRRTLRRSVYGAVTVALAASLTLIAPTASFAANPVIDIDLAYSLGAVTHGASGSLYAISQNGTPSPDKFAGLNMQTIGQMAPGGTQHPDGDALKVGPEFYAAGGKNVMVYIQDYYPSWPYTKVSMTDYAKVVTTEVNKIKAAPDASKYIYVPFNEPDWIWYGTSGSKLTSFLNDWKTIFQKIRSLDSSAKIAGPGFSAYNETAYKSFLSFAKANGVLPNIMTWHELGSGFKANWYTHYNTYRANEHSLGISSIPININEYGQSTGEMGIPGKMMQYLARFDATRVSGCMAAWAKIGDISQLLTSNFQKASAWYLYNWYGQMSGNSARVTPPSGTGDLQAVASIASSKTSASVIVGGASGNADIRIAGMSSTSLGTNVKVTISTLVNSGGNSSNGPTVTSTTTKTVSGGVLTVTITGMAANNAYLVKLG
jgi:hypothetical protein